VRRKWRFSPGLIAALIAIVTILVAIPVTVVSGYIPATVTDHKPAWIAGLVGLLAVVVVLAVLAAGSAGPEPEPVARN
jgi:hypothetical protein